MNTSPYTYKQAVIIAESFQFLKGRAFDKEHAGTTPVLDILVVPFDEEAQDLFMDEYSLTGSKDLHRYHGLDAGFEVIVVARYVHDPEIYLWMDVQSFAQNNLNVAAENGVNGTTLMPLGKELAA